MKIIGLHNEIVRKENILMPYLSHATDIHFFIIFFIRVFFFSIEIKRKF